ncbi:MAG: SPOR domain-containing protein, partial [Bacteroidales bacterium]|nr:SPOR domain-containing protein [Bacteroidales bacterium]
KSSESIKDSAMSTTYNFNNDNQVYTVQIGAFLQNTQTNKYFNVTNLYNHLYDDGFNRYYTGVFETYVEAVVYLKQVKKDGYNDAFVVGLKGEDRKF